MSKLMRQKILETILFIGRFSPPHKGHIKAILGLLAMYDRVVIVLGSCYEVGTPRHPLLAIYREKMLLYSLKQAGVDMRRIKIVHLEDFNNWEAWWKKIMTICKRYSAKQVSTGNVEDIIGPLTEKGLLPDWLKLVNCEAELPEQYRYNYRATDLRNAVLRGDYRMFLEIAAPGTVALMGNVGGFVGIRQALANQGKRFVPGRQAVDAIIVTEHRGKTWIMCGYRSPEKRNFPGCLAIPGGGVWQFESPIDTTLREVKQETGFEFVILDRCLEPAHVMLKGIDVLCEMKSLGIFSTPDKGKAGDQGGSSQPFLFRLDVHPRELRPLIKESSELLQVDFYPEDYVKKQGLAFQQLEMVQKAGYCL
ncbi:NUDIX domain-containing protein [Candidatus Falkowbacteria bacterium]|nr:NUDIX domain-containing protein [Candidatus Falkowbacteria bacterium]